MISIFVENRNHFSQDFYDSLINSLQLHQLKCSCGHSGCLTIHGYYFRHLRHPDGLLRLRICRVRCSECDTTHALLPSMIVPYSQISVSDQNRICRDYDEGRRPSDICEENPSIDENNVKHVVRNYRRRWREMPRSLRVSLLPLSSLICACFSNYSLQFMQTHRGKILLFQITT